MDWSKVKVTLAGTHALTITFHDPIDQLVAPITHHGEVPVEYVAAALSYIVLAKQAAGKGAPLPPAAPW